jgi:hypothetical protein
MEKINLALSTKSFAITQLCLSGFEKNKHDSPDKCSVPFVPVLWVLKSLVSVSSKIRLRTPNVPFFPPFLILCTKTELVATVCARTEGPSANDYWEGMGQAEEDA